MNTPLNGIIKIGTILLAICLTGAGVLEYRKRADAAARSESILTGKRTFADATEAARELARICSDLKTATAYQAYDAADKIKVWLRDTGHTHPLSKDAESLVIQCQLTHGELEAKEWSIAKSYAKDLNQKADDVFQIAVNFQP